MAKSANKNKKSLTSIFLEIAKPDEEGFSRVITIDELVAINPDFKTGNGCGWGRSDGALKEFNVKRELVGNKVVSIKLDGKNKNQKNRAISESIKKNINKKPCAILNINSNIECDHKDGMYDDSRVADVRQQKEDDFQPLSKAANGAKRTHCNNCKDTGKRFDATRLGYSAPFTKGDADTKSCVGCYWYDPKAFNKLISKDFKKDV